MQEPVCIAMKPFRRMVTKAARLKELPGGYPTVDDVDELINQESFQELRYREDIFAYFAICVAMGFSSDEKWHMLHPKQRTICPDNVVEYIFTPYDGEDALLPHVGIWKVTDSKQVKEDIQAAFEYMQGILMDPEMYVFDTPFNGD